MRNQKIRDPYEFDYAGPNDDLIRENVQQTPSNAGQDPEFKDFFYEKTLRETQRKAEDEYDDQVKQLETDKVALIKRLNMVLLELDRVTQEKADINNNIVEQYSQTENLQKRLERASETTETLNTNLQEDLKYERELNEQLRSEIEKYENQKNRLIQEVEENAEIHNEADEERLILSSNLDRKNKELNEVESHYKDTLLKIRDVEGEIADMDASENINQEEKERLNDDLQKLNDERNDMIYRMNDLTSKYEMYVNSMTKEREEISKANHRHMKLLSAKIIFLQLARVIRHRSKDAFVEVRRCAQYEFLWRTRLVQLIRNALKCEHRTVETAFLQWKSISLRWIQAKKSKDKIVETKAQQKIKMEFFSKWRKAFLTNVRNVDSKVDTAQILSSLIFRIDERTKRNKFTRWKNFRQRMADRDSLLRKSLSKLYTGRLEACFLHWLRFSTGRKEKSKFDLLANQIAEFRFKSRMFSKLRFNVKFERDRKVAELLTTLHEKGLEHKQSNYVKNATIVTLTMEKRKEEKLIRRVFDTLKLRLMESKYEKASKELEIEKPKRKELEQSIKGLKESEFDHNLKHYLRTCAVTFKTRLKSYFYHWRQFIFKYNENHVVMKKILLRLMNYKLSSGFYLWKRHSHSLLADKASQEKRQMENTLDEIKAETDALHYDLSRYRNLSNKNRINKLTRCVHQRSRRFMKKFLKCWFHSSARFRDIEVAAQILQRKIQKHAVISKFAMWREKNFQMKRKILVQMRKKFLLVLGAGKLLKKIFDSWVLFANNNKKMKLTVWRMKTRNRKDMIDKAFQKWKVIKNLQVKADIVNETDDIFAENIELKSQLENLHAINEEKAENQSMLIKRLVDQSRGIMAKYTRRMVFNVMGQGFYKWLSIIKSENRSYQLMKRLLLKWYGGSCYAGFQQWKEYVYEEKIAEQKYLLKKEKLKYRKFKADSSASLLSCQENIDETKFKINLLTTQKEFHKKRMQKIFLLFQDRARETSSISNVRIVLSEWRGVVEKEKAAITGLLQKSKNSILTDFFVRMKEIYLQLRSDANVNGKLTRAQRIFKRFHIKCAFQRWRGFAGEMMFTAFEETKAEMQVEEQQATQRKAIVKEKYMDQCGNLGDVKRKRKHFIAWRARARLQAKIGHKKTLASQNIEYVRIRNALKKWQDRKNITIKRRLRIRKGVNHFHRFSLRKFLDYWQRSHDASRILPKIMKKFVSRSVLGRVQNGFNQLRANAKLKTHVVANLKQNSADALLHIMQKIFIKRKANALQKLKYKGRSKEINDVALKRNVLRGLNRRLRYYFDNWRNLDQINQTVQFMEIEGERTLESCKLHRKLESMKAFMNDEKYKPEQVKQDLAQRGQEKDNKLKWAIEKWLRNKQEEIALSKTISQWKRWVNLRALFQRAANFYLKRFQKPDLHAAFSRWKLYGKSASKLLREMPKHDLIKKCVDDDRNINVLKIKNENVGKVLKDLEIEQGELVQKYVRGKALACHFLKKLVHSVLRQSFHKWRKEEVKGNTQEYRDSLRTTILKLSELRSAQHALNSVHEDLREENDDLREAALHGLEIAKAVQDMTREREQLSGDLANRGMTIKRLLEDNANLTRKLELAQEEAAKLIRLTGGNQIPEHD